MRNLKALTFLLLAGTFIASPALAASFYIQEQSASGLGTAFAGAVADTQDASTIFYNPAGMTDLGRAQAVGGVTFLIPDANFKNTGSTIRTTVGTGNATIPMQGRNGGNPFNLEMVPNAYIAMPLTPAKNLWAGIGVSAPFGLANKYDKDFIGRYDSMQNKLRVLDFAPSLAWAPSKHVSFGGGVNIQHADAMLKSAIPSTITAGGPIPGTDGMTDLSGDDVTIGFNAGIIVKPVEGTRLGLHYKQGIAHNLEGRLITRVPSDVPGVGGTQTNVAGSAELDLPDIASFGVSQQVTDKITVLGSVNWYEWSNFNDIPVNLATGTDSQSLQNYEDTWGFALGARYDATEDLTLKVGLQFDQTPTVDNFRSTRIPDGDRTWVTAGATYDIDDQWQLDFSAAYVDVSEEQVNQVGNVTIGGTTATHVTRGEVDGSVGIISTAIKYKFGTP